MHTRQSYHTLDHLLHFASSVSDDHRYITDTTVSAQENVEFQLTALIRYLHLFVPFSLLKLTHLHVIDSGNTAAEVCVDATEIRDLVWFLTDDSVYRTASNCTRRKGGYPATDSLSCVTWRKSKRGFVCFSLLLHQRK